MSDILDKTRRAFVSYLLEGPIGTANVYDAKSADDKAESSVTVDATEAKEDPPGSGNFWVGAEVLVKSMAPVDADGAVTKAASDDLSAGVMNLLEIDNDSLKAALSGQIAGLTVMGFGEEKEFEQFTAGDAWVTRWKRRIYCGGF